MRSWIERVRLIRNHDSLREHKGTRMTALIRCAGSGGERTLDSLFSVSMSELATLVALRAMAEGTGGRRRLESNTPL